MPTEDNINKATDSLTTVLLDIVGIDDPTDNVTKGVELNRAIKRLIAVACKESRQPEAGSGGQ